MFKKDKKAKPKAAPDDDAAKKAAEDEAASKAKADEEAAAKAVEEAAAKAKAEEEAKAKEAGEAAKKAKEEEERKAKEEAEIKAKAAAEADAAAKQAKEEEERKAREAEEAAKKAKEEEERKAREAGDAVVKAEAARRAQEEAIRRAMEEEERKKKEEEEKAERARQRKGKALCAPLPGGVEARMDLSSLFDLQVAFGMLDKQKKGFLDRKQARDFMRCAGWIVTDENLDNMLDGAVASVAKLLGPSKGTRVVNPNATFTLEELLEIVEKNMKGSNSSIDDITAAICKLAGSKSQIKKKRLQDVVCESQDFDEIDVDSILKMVDLKKEGHLDCKTLADRLLKSVCEPPSILSGKKK